MPIALLIRWAIRLGVAGLLLRARRGGQRPLSGAARLPRVDVERMLRRGAVGGRLATRAVLALALLTLTIGLGVAALTTLLLGPRWLGVVFLVGAVLAVIAALQASRLLVRAVTR